MPGYDRDQVVIDATTENRRLGSVLLTVGWILLWGAALFSIFFFISLRDGSMFWPVALGITGLLGLVLVLMGNHYRRAIGPTRLGTRDEQNILRQQKQDEDEERTVA